MDTSSIDLANHLKIISDSLSAVGAQISEIKKESQPMMQYWPLISGVLGTVCGVSGLILSIFSYRKNHRTRTQDLRIQIKKSVHDIRALGIDNKELISKAIRSREAVSAAMGSYNSGAMVKFKKEASEDLVLVSKTLGDLPSVEKPWEKISMDEIEKEMVRVHAISIKLNGIKEKYGKTIEEDGDSRKFIRDQAHKRP
jgi:hypothetical protein